MKIAIDDDIGWWGISEKSISEQLSALKEGEEIEVVINSAGGSVYEGIAIFNVLRKAAESHPVHIWINGLAASMASYIAIAGRAYDKNLKITVNENSIYFIHNPWNYSVGDYRVLRKEADYLDRLAKVCGLAYSAVSSIAIKKIREAMDEETYYIGQEIIDAGFANDFEPLYTTEETNANAEDRDSLIAQAHVKLQAVMTKSREKLKADEAEKAVAFLISNNFLSIEKPGDKPAGKKGGVMKPEELLAQDQDCYKAVMSLGEAAALEKERKRINAHLKMGKESGDLELAAKFIQEGKSIQDDEVHADYLAAAMKKKNLQGRIEDNPPPAGTEGSDDADEAELMKSFDLGYKKKDGGKE